MANRSDFLSPLPRTLKKMISLIPNIDAHQRGEIRRAFLAVHSHHKEVVSRRQSARTNVDVGSEDLSPEESTVKE